MRHEIVHNKHVVDSLKAIGVICVEELNEIQDKSRPVIFSAHGVPKNVPEQANNYKIEYIDVSGMCAEAMRRSHNGESLKELYDQNIKYPIKK